MTDATEPVIDGYTPADLVRCRAMWVELTLHHRKIYVSPGIGGDDPGRQFDEHLARVGAGNLWVARLQDRVVGLVGLIPGDGEAELEPLVVSRDVRRRGLGRRLAATAIAAARAAGARRFSVRPVARNDDAIRFFHAMGFDTLGHVEMFMDLDPRRERIWIEGPILSDRQTRR